MIKNLEVNLKYICECTWVFKNILGFVNRDNWEATAQEDRKPGTQVVPSRVCEGRFQSPWQMEHSSWLVFSSEESGPLVMVKGAKHAL